MPPIKLMVCSKDKKGNTNYCINDDDAKVTPDGFQGNIPKLHLFA